MSLQSKYASVVSTELRHHAVWEPGEPIRLGDYGILQHGRFSVQGNVKDEFGLDFEVIRSRKREYAFRSDGVSESRGDAKAAQPGTATELRIGFRRADALYVSSPSAWTEHIKGLGRLLTPLQKDPQWRPEWVVVTRLYMASPAIILLSNADNADVKIHLGADGVAVGGEASNESGEQGSVALQLTGVHGALFMGLHRVTKNEVDDVLPARRLLSRVMVLAGAGLVGGGALATWLVLGVMHDERVNQGIHDAPQTATLQAVRDEGADSSEVAQRPAHLNGKPDSVTTHKSPHDPKAQDVKPNDPQDAGGLTTGTGVATGALQGGHHSAGGDADLSFGHLGNGGGSGGAGRKTTTTTTTGAEGPEEDEPSQPTLPTTMSDDPLAAESKVVVATSPPARADVGSKIVLLWIVVIGIASLSAVALVYAVVRRRRITPVIEVDADAVRDLQS